MIHQIRAAYWQRTAHHRAELRIGAQLRAIKKGLARRGEDEFTPLLYPVLHEVHYMLHRKRLETEKPLRELQKQLPIYEFAKTIRGFGGSREAISLAQIVGEAGDLSQWRTLGGLWKRFGLHVMDGKAARPKRGVVNGFSPARRALMSVIGENLVKLNKGYYRTLYDERKAYEIARAPDMKPIITHRRAKRYMEKRLLKHLRQAWRRAKATATTAKMSPAALDSGAYQEAAE